jgi:hypothetical protein
VSADPADVAPADGGPPPGEEWSGPSLERLRALLIEEGGLIGGLVCESPGEKTARSGGSIGIGMLRSLGPAQTAARGPRADGNRAEYELLVETIYEGYLLHYHAPRVVRPPEQDLGLLVGDRLYALGLAKLVKLGDVEAVAELADVITLSSLAQAADNPDLAQAVWMAGSHAVAWGASPEHSRAKALTRAASPEALEAMRRLLPAQGS